MPFPSGIIQGKPYQADDPTRSIFHNLFTRNDYSGFTKIGKVPGFFLNFQRVLPACKNQTFIVQSLFFWLHYVRRKIRSRSYPTTNASRPRCRTGNITRIISLFRATNQLFTGVKLAGDVQVVGCEITIRIARY